MNLLDRRVIRKQRSSFVDCLYRHGYTYSQIASRLELSIERVRQLRMGHLRDTENQMNVFLGLPLAYEYRRVSALERARKEGV